VLEADDLVLLGLDRRDDVAHRPGARRVEGREERGVGPRRPVGSRPVVQQVVVRVEHGPPAGSVVPPAHQPFRTRRRGRVERARGRGAPVDEQRLQVVVEQPDAAHEHPGAVRGVGAAEADPVAVGTQPPDTRGQRAYCGLPQRTLAR
jgi:hypothetical protein